MFIRGVILAAGTSSRMGTNKLALEICGKSVINRVIENAKSSKLDEIVLVHGKYDVETDLKKIYNDRFQEGMSTSIISGLMDFNGDAVMFLLGDMPFVSSSIIDELIDAFVRSSKNIIVPSFNGRRGNPVIIGSEYFQELYNNCGDKGARDIIQMNPDDIELVEIMSDTIFQDIDDENTLKIFAGNGEIHELF